jgi:YD repeat-containing protein
MISRELIDSVPRANVEVAYAQDGRLTRREQWEFYWATRTATLRSSTRYTWAEGRIVSRQEEQSVTTLGYDAEGLPLRIETKPLPGFSWAPLTLTYEWKGRRLRTKPKLGFPSRADGVMLPLWIPFHGTVKVVRTSSLSKREETVTFNAQGFRSSQGWTSSASVPLVPPPPQTWRWVGTQVVESNSGPQMHADIAWPEVRSTFTYDAEGRPTSYLHFQSNHEGGRVQTSEQRYEYRCPGEFVADPLWGP